MSSTNEWVGVVGAVVGGFLTGGVSYLTTIHGADKERRWQLTKDIQRRIEELAELLDQVEQRYSALTGSAVLAIWQHQSMEFQNEVLPVSRIRAIVRFHVPELTNDQSKLETARDEYGKALIKVMRAEELSKEDKQKLTARLMTLERVITDICKEMCEGAATLLREKLNRELAPWYLKIWNMMIALQKHVIGWVSVLYTAFVACVAPIDKLLDEISTKVDDRCIKLYIKLSEWNR